MAYWVSDQINVLYSGFLGGTATAGVAGGPQLVRASEVRGITKVHRFTVEQATPNPLPDSPVAVGSSFVGGDTVILAWMDPTERIYFGRAFITSAFASTMSFGKIDTNWSNNTDLQHYLANGAGAVGQLDFAANMTEQVGADPRGDQTLGNWIPAFGSGKIWLTLTFGSTPSAGAALTGFILTVEEGN